MKNCGIDFEKTAWDVLTAAISLYEKSDFMFYYRIKYLVIVSSRTGSSSELPKVDSQLIIPPKDWRAIDNKCLIDGMTKFPLKKLFNWLKFVEGLSKISQRNSVRQFS